MSVVKRKRNKSTFEVFHHLTKMRKDITDLLLRDFGYDFDKFRKQLDRKFGNKSYEEMSDAQRIAYSKQLNRADEFNAWYIISYSD